jgi:hypothetical protein
MIRLTDRRLEILRELATPLSPFLRGRFLRLVAERLTNITIGDGAVHQAGIAAQHEWGTPKLTCFLLPYLLPCFLLSYFLSLY